LVYSFVKDKRADVGLELDITVCGNELIIPWTIEPQVYHQTITANDEPITIDASAFFAFSYDASISSSKCEGNTTLALYQDEEL
jgi:hypothetical protein